MAFSEKLTALKTLLKESLGAENVELFSKIDKGLDELNVEHKTTEEKLTQTQDKLIEIVKGTSFKVEDTPDKTPGDTTEENSMDLDKAFESAFEEIQSNRKKEA